MRTTGKLRVGDLVQKRASKAPFPRQFRVVEFINGGSDVMVRPASGGSLIEMRASALTTPREDDQ